MELNLACRKGSGSDEIILPDAPVQSIAAGHSFDITAGCDKQAMTCQDKFANIANFRGFPDIPGNETIFRSVHDDGANDGSVL